MPTAESLQGEAASAAPPAPTRRRRRGRRGLLIALAIFLSLVGGAHLYFARRLVLATELPEPWQGWGLSALALGAASLFAGPLGERLLPPRVSRVLAWPAYLWMGACFYLLVGLWASDLVMLFGGIEGLAAERMRALLVAGGAGAIVLGGLAGALRVPAVKRVELELPGWPAALDGYRVAQISDVHVGPLLRRPWVERLVQRVNDLDADLVAVTGDLVDGDVERLREHVEPLSELAGRDGVFFVTGNHEYISNADPWVGRAEELGWSVLRNRSEAVKRRNGSFHVAGVDDLSSRRGGGRGGHDLEAALSGIHDGTPVLLLAHNPNTFLEARKRGVALQLSGHTHGGQMWPFSGLVRLTTPFVAGTYRSGRSTLYVSRGTGFWGPPIRVGAPAEITELLLKAAPAAS